MICLCETCKFRIGCGMRSRIKPSCDSFEKESEKQEKTIKDILQDKDEH